MLRQPETCTHKAHLPWTNVFVNTTIATSIQDHSTNPVAFGRNCEMVIWEKQEGNQGRFVVQTRPIRQCPEQLCRPLMGCLVAVCNVSVCICAWEMILRIWRLETRTMMVSEDALAVRRLKAAPVVQNSRADHWGDIKCSFEQALTDSANYNIF